MEKHPWKSKGAQQGTRGIEPQRYVVGLLNPDVLSSQHNIASQMSTVSTHTGHYRYSIMYRLTYTYILKRYENTKVPLTTCGLKVSERDAEELPIAMGGLSTIDSSDSLRAF